MGIGTIMALELGVIASAFGIRYIKNRKLRILAIIGLIALFIILLYLVVTLLLEDYAQHKSEMEWAENITQRIEAMQEV